MPMSVLEDQGFRGSLLEAKLYNLSQDSVYSKVAEGIDVLLRANSISLSKLCLDTVADIMIVIRYTYDLIDIFDADVQGVVAEVDNPVFFSAFSDVRSRVKLSGDETAFVVACKKTLSATRHQLSATNSRYVYWRLVEGGYTGEILYYAISQEIPAHQRELAKSLLFTLGASCNLWDTLWDLKEDSRYTLANLFRTWAYLIRESTSLLARSKERIRLLRMLYGFVRAHYFSDSARARWKHASRRSKWESYALSKEDALK